VQRLRGAPAGAGETVVVGGAEHPLGALQAELLVHTAGDSIAYLTDFRMTPAASADLAARLRGVNTVVCESQYRGADVELAERVRHSTAEEVAATAAAAGVGKLVLFHFSERYDAAGRRDMLHAARAVFPNTHLPDGWAEPS
jgi:ribonuclease Z